MLLDYNLTLLRVVPQQTIHQSEIRSHIILHPIARPRPRPRALFKPEDAKDEVSKREGHSPDEAGGGCRRSCRMCRRQGPAGRRSGELDTQDLQCLFTRAAP